MSKKLPGVFPGKVRKNAGNNKKVFYSEKEEKEERIIKSRSEKSNKYIIKKLNEIFNSPSYIYKADVIIKTSNETFIKRIIGRNKNYLITIENELIPINTIIDIEIKKQE